MEKKIIYLVFFLLIISIFLSGFNENNDNQEKVNDATFEYKDVVYEKDIGCGKHCNRTYRTYHETYKQYSNGTRVLVNSSYEDRFVPDDTCCETYFKLLNATYYKIYGSDTYAGCIIATSDTNIPAKKSNLEFTIIDGWGPAMMFLNGNVYSEIKNGSYCNISNDIFTGTNYHICLLTSKKDKFINGFGEGKHGFEASYDSFWGKNDKISDYYFELNRVSFNYFNTIEEIEYNGFIDKKINPEGIEKPMIFTLKTDDTEYYLINENEEVFVGDCIFDECGIENKEVKIVGKQGYLIHEYYDCLVSSIKVSSISLK